jgi:UDP-N-acetylmuramoyl-tripeptide--D-alanyl-D-alanine ligase
MNLKQLAKCMGQTVELETEIEGLAVNDQLIKPGYVFVATKGSKLDGHDFAKSAEAKGAIAIIAEKPIAGLTIPVFLTMDYLADLTKIAKQHRQALDIKIMALTGSNGKTTVKDMLAEIMPESCYVSHGNFNNHLGVPINLMSVRANHDMAVFELGANSKGDIAHTASLLSPDICLINNIGPAHLGGFGSLDGVASAKGEIYQALKPGGIAIVNDDDVYAHYWDGFLVNKKILRFSSQHQADIYASNIEFKSDGCFAFKIHFSQGESISIQLQVPGRHQVQNALAAASMSYAAGIDVLFIQQGLCQFRGVRGRLNILKGPNGSTIIDDSYNANLASIKAGIDVLASYPGIRILAIGDVAELGEHSQVQHEAIGIYAKERGINQLFAVGNACQYTVAAFGSGGKHFANRQSLAQHLRACLNDRVSVLVKGSRSSRMDEIIQLMI